MTRSNRSHCSFKKPLIYLFIYMLSLLYIYNICSLASFHEFLLYNIFENIYGLYLTLMICTGRSQPGLLRLDINCCLLALSRLPNDY